MNQDRKNALLILLTVTMLYVPGAIMLHRHTGDAPAPVMEGHHHVRWWNLEVTGHFFGIMEHFHSSAPSSHWFGPSSPCAGLAKPCETSVAPSPRLDNRLVYISFPPGGMIITYALMELLHGAAGAEFSVATLRSVNLFYGYLAVLIFAITLNRLAEAEGGKRYGIVAFGALPLAVALEPLHSYHLVIWSQQVLQPILALVLLSLTRPMSNGNALRLGILCALACWIEWTAYPLCVAVFLAIAIDQWHSKPAAMARTLSLYSAAALSGGMTLLAYYHVLLGGLDKYLLSQKERAAARSMVDYYGFSDWFSSLYISFGPWLLATIALLAILGVGTAIGRESQNGSALPKKFWMLLLVSTFVLIENILMFEHTIVYTFDWLKWGFPIGLILSGIGKKLSERGPAWFALGGIAVLVAAGASILDFLELYRPYWRG